MGQSGYDWVAVDMEHGSIVLNQLPNIFRALELGGTLPLVRLAQGHIKDCRQALDAGAGGVIVPMVENANQLINMRDASCWPPSGNRGVGFSRANLFGKSFNNYIQEAKSPLLIAQIEHRNALDNLDEILQVKGLDAIIIGPYDFSASMGLTGDFENDKFKVAMKQVIDLCNKYKVPCGNHIVKPDAQKLKWHIDEGYNFIPYGTDAVFLYTLSINPLVSQKDT
jgi:2-dehydro-3-deoxyglucarate aldolase